MQIKSTKTVIPGLVAAFGVLIVLHTVSLPSYNTLWREIANFGHVPIFGLLAIIVLHLSETLLGDILKNRIRHLLLVMAVITTIGALSEIIQIIGPRDADWYDLLRDIVGAIIFLGVVSTLPVGRFPTLGFIMTKKAKVVVNLASMILLLLSLTPIFYWSFAFLHRSQQFPLLCGFESIWEYGFVGSNFGRVEFIEAPSGWVSASLEEGERAQVGSFKFNKVRHPGFYISEPYPDFSGYDTLSMIFFSMQDSVISMTVRIDDMIHNYQYNDRYNMSFTIRPGMNRIDIPCDDIRYAPANREMDMTAIASIHIFTIKPVKPFVLFFDNLLLN